MGKIWISCICDMAIFLWFNRKNSMRSYYGIRLFLGYVLMGTVTYVLNKCNINMAVLRILVNIGFYFLIYIMLYILQPLRLIIERILCLIGCLLIAELSTSLVLMIATNHEDIELFLEKTFFWFVSLLISKCCEVVFLNMVNKSILERNRDYKMFPVHFLCIGVLLGYLYFITYYFTMDKFISSTFELICIVNIVFVLIIFVGNIIFADITGKIKYQEKEIEILTEKTSAQMDSYEEISNYKKQLRKIYHDLRNQVLIAGSLTDNEVGQKYLDSLEEYFKPVLKKANTGNEVLDILIARKQEVCERREIDFRYNVDFRAGDFINLVDIGMIFGNAIDNAIEGCERAQVSEKSIELLVHTYEESIFVRISNPVEEIVEKDGKLLTLKKNKKQHGIGMISMQEALEKYGGTYQYKIKDRKFILSILIPITQ